MKKVIFGCVLTKLRKDCGFSQKIVADALSVSRPTYVSWENDCGDLPITKMFLLSEFYQIPAATILQLICKQNNFEQVEVDIEKALVIKNLLMIQTLLDRYKNVIQSGY